jgi:hypothetical protein
MSSYFDIAIVPVRRPSVTPGSLPNRNEILERFASLVHDSPAMYWSDQSGFRINYWPTVYDWSVYSENPTGKNQSTGLITVFESRPDVATKATEIAIPNEKIYKGYDGIIVVFALGPGESASFGSAGIIRDPSIPCILTDLNQAFDFNAHELGHMFGLDHSFDTSPVTYSPGADDRPGCYGHPYCVMSAQTYARRAHVFTPPGETRPSLSSWPPDLNAAAALRRGWITAETLNLDSLGNGFAEIEIFRRGFGSGNTAFRLIENAGTREHVLEYRRTNSRYGHGLESDLLIHNGGMGFQGGVEGGCFVAVLNLPANSRLPKNRAFKIGNYFAEPIRFGSTRDSIVIKVSKAQRVFGLDAPTFQTIGAIDSTEGVFVTERDETCIRRGTEFKWKRRTAREKAKLEFRFETAQQPDVHWFIDGQVLPSSNGTISSKFIQIFYPYPLPDGDRRVHKIPFNYERIDGPGLSTLLIEPDGVFASFEIEVTVTCDLPPYFGTFIKEVSFATDTVEILGFAEQRLGCLVERYGREKPKFPGVVPRHIWEVIPKDKKEIITDLLTLYSKAQENGDLDTLPQLQLSINHILQLDSDVTIFSNLPPSQIE